jgi:hypothetical protein
MQKTLGFPFKQMTGYRSRIFVSVNYIGGAEHSTPIRIGDKMKTEN